MQGENVRNRRKVMTGFVVSTKMDKTIVVVVKRRTQHPKYKKFLNKTYRLYAHDEENRCLVGDEVEVMETKPLSKTKRWRLTRVVKQAEAV